MGAGLEEGYVLAGRDLLRGVRWQGETTVSNEPVDRAVTEDEIPTVARSTSSRRRGGTDRRVVARAADPARRLQRHALG